MSLVLRSNRVFFDTAIRPADIRIDHDTITEIAQYGSLPHAVDLGSRLVTPGFIDLHSDAVEKEIEPRPGAAFPVVNALIELDKKLAMAGITTMFHSIAFNEESLVGQRGTETAARLIHTICKTNETLLAIDNLVHARYEITSFSSVPHLKNLMAEGRIQLLSFMDHSPGQGQFTSLEKWKQYHVPVYDLAGEDVDIIVSHQLDKKSRCMDHLQDLSEIAQSHDILIASHDDDTPEKVDLMESLGISIAEFPLSLETAAYARKKRVATSMGAPNVVRGKSQSGNISARLLIEQGCCDFLCSDYHPSSMLQAVYSMHREMGLDLPETLAYITSTPARTARLHDRGEIGPGKIADLAVIEDHFVPKVVMTLKSGQPIYNSSRCLCFHEHA